MTIHDTELAVVAQAQAIYQGNGDPELLLAAFRAAELHLCRQVSPPAIPVIEVPGMGNWLQVFTTVGRLTAVVGAEYDFMTLPGSFVLDLLLPLLPHGIGVVLDPGTTHMIALPPVEPIVAHAQALQQIPVV